MAEYGYGYRTQFDKPTPLTYKGVSIPEFTKPGAKVSIASATVANRLSLQPMKDSTISFSIQLEANTGSDVSMTIDPSVDVPGANPKERQPDAELYAKLFKPGALPKVQSFKAALHSKNPNQLLIVGGRIAGLHSFGGKGFQQIMQNFALFVVDMSKTPYLTSATALPSTYFDTVGLMNAQATQVKGKDGRNYLYIAGGYGYDPTLQDMKTFNTLTVLDVDGLADSIVAAAAASAANPPKLSVPDLESYIWQTHHESIQVTGGVMMFNPASNEPSTPGSDPKDSLYMVVGQTFQGSYSSGSNDIYTYIRGMRKFEVPYPTSGEPLPSIIVTDIVPSSDTSNSPDYLAAMSSQLARRDLNVVPTFLPGTFTFGDGTALPGATILSGVFNQDGSNAPYLQPIVVNFNSTNKTRDPNPKYIPVYSSMAFFQLFNSYDCCNLQLFSVENKQGNIYNVLCGGVSFFYKTNDPNDAQLDQVNSLFKAPFTTDISIVKQDNQGHFTQRLVPPAKSTAQFLKDNKLSMFGAESFFIPNPKIPLTKALPESSGVLDLDWIKAQGQAKYKLGSMYGGIENKPTAYPAPYPPSFQPEQTDATSRMVDIYITFGPQ